MQVLTALLLFPALLFGQQQAPVFRATTQLVEFTFVALDKHGKAVADLRPEEVQVYENGKLREPAFMEVPAAQADSSRIAAHYPAALA